ncbi:putative uncharacterized protein [Janthinobacterium agaricidamnosum NBRC 102515 = DSM 9628]|uniref:Single Cache domain-containing protein n=1 Tax=Janthinobacterium agaricidamnosum NBRC 102515 = DSM 9628 TaxID=1349767 RepID=W0UZB5_9BURK|nr:putative uncharacterized protein [Janthinobacterium agaricidamnosum NBRC 102515 = DSM 9628]
MAAPSDAQNNRSDAIALVDKAVANIQKKGIEDACKDFADAKSGYIKGDLYVFVHNDSASMICHATNPKLNGRAMVELKDADGKFFVKEMRDRAMAGESAWINYIWLNPVTKALEEKSSYVRKATNQYWVGVGIYQKK